MFHVILGLNQVKRNNKWLNLVLCSLLVFVFLGFIGDPVIAHSPSSMTLEYNSVTERLTVDITHSVADGNTHYVDNVLVTVNGETEVDQDYTSQSGSTFSYTYEDMYADENDTIEVLASCNQGGSITQSIVVSGEKTSSADNDTSTPGFEIVFLFIAFLILLFVLRRKNHEI